MYKKKQNEQSGDIKGRGIGVRKVRANPGLAKIPGTRPPDTQYKCHSGGGAPAGIMPRPLMPATP